MKAYLSRRYHFSASHRLHSDAFSEERNYEIYGKCNNPYGHGHNYVVEVTVGGQLNEATGMICNLVDLDSCVHQEVIARFDHTNLNLHKSFADEVPTTENVCIGIYKLLKPAIPGLVRIRVEETGNNSFEYEGRA